jgi:molybdopterin-biosynthesis enzyme MoeA-like protein
VVTVGQEILYGERANDNLSWLLRAFVRYGVPAIVGLILPDDEVVIGKHLKTLLSLGYRPIFVSGGIGGTHDDRTRQGIALGLGRPLVKHSECFERLARRYGARFNEQRQRMAWLPEGSQLIENPRGAPGFFVDSVYAFPGFPEMLHPMAEETLTRLLGNPPEKGSRALELTLKVPEGDIAAEVERFANAHPGVEIGLYPRITPEGPMVTVRCRCWGHDPGVWSQAEGFLKNLEGSYPVAKALREFEGPEKT